MTRVRMGLRAPVELAGGRMEWRPRRHVDGPDVVLPDVVHVALVEGVETFAEIPVGVWWVDELVAEAGESRVLLVPDTEETVNYADLVDVDPATLDPVGPPPVDAWEAALGDAVHEATERADGFAADAGGHALAAGGSAISAAGSRDLAAGEAAAAGQARAGAEIARDAAVTSRGQAEASATAAGTSATAANLSDGRAEDFADQSSASASAALQEATMAGQHANTASNAAADATAAKTAAETARTEANQARTDARAARDETYVTVTSAPQGGGTANLAGTTTRSRYLIRTLTGNVVFTLNSGTAGVAYTCTLELRQDATGGRAVTFAGTNVRLPYGVQPAITTAPNGVDIVQLLWTGTYWVVLSGASDIRVVP